MAIWTTEIKELEKLYESLKGQLPDLEKELTRLVKADDENMILLYARRCLEVIITDLCACELKRDRGTEPLKGIIDKLHKEEKVPSHIITSMDHLNSLSAYGAHPKDFDPEQVKPVLINLNIIIKWYLKYKKSGTEINVKTTEEETRQEVKSTEDVKKGIQISRKRLISFITGSILLIVIVVAVLFFTNIIGGGKKIQELEKSIAVLPFKLLSNESDKQYLADGMMDMITLHLSKIKELRVLGRTSTEQYRNPTKTLAKIGNELGVNYLLEGSFQKFGDSVRLIVQLIKTGKEGHVWADEYDRNWKDVFSVQSEVAQSIAKELNAAITPSEKQLIEKTPTSNLAAYDFYQLGKDEYFKYWVNSDDVEALGRAEFYYYKALEHDPEFAQSYTGLARIYFNKNFWNEYFNENFLDSVLVLCKIALSFDKNDYETHTVMGNVYRWRGVTKKALEEYNQALRINPNSWEAYYGIGQLYYYSDLIKKIENTLKAISLNHGTQLPILFREIADAYTKAGFPEKRNYYVKEAFKQDGDSVQLLVNSGVNVEILSKGAYKIDSTSSDLLVNMGFKYFWNKQYKESLIYFKKYLNRISTTPEKNEQHGWQFSFFSRLGYAYLQNGYKKEGKYYIDKQFQNTLNEIRLGRLRSLIDYYDLAGLYAYRGDKIKAYENLKVFIQKNSYIYFGTYNTIKIDPFFDTIRNEPEFQQIIKEMEYKYEAGHEQVRKWLEEQGML
jgi:TolB-like protein